MNSNYNKDYQIGEFIKTLSKEYMNEQELLDVSEIFKEIYKSDTTVTMFRHSYSNIMFKINDIGADKGDLGILSSNMERFKIAIIDNPDYEGLKSNLYKLYDHIMLEIGRFNIINTSYQNTNAIRAQMLNIKAELEETGSKFNETSNKVEHNIEKNQKKSRAARKEIDKIKTEFVAILGIFAAMIVAFAGGISISSNVLESLSNVPVYKAIIMLLISGLVLYNGIFGLMHIISKLTGRSIYHSCTVLNEEQKKVKRKRCSGCPEESNCNLQRRILRKYPYTYYLNYLFLGLLFITTAAWIIDFRIVVIYIQTSFKYWMQIHPGIMLMVIIIFIAGAYKLHRWYTNKSSQCLISTNDISSSDEAAQ